MTDPPVWLPTASGSIPAATAAAEPEEEPPRRVLEIARIARRGRIEKGQRGGHRLADDDAAGAADHRYQRGVGYWPVAGIDRRAVRGQQIGGVKQFLYADRQSPQRRHAQIAGGPLGALARPLEVEHGEGADLAFATRDCLSA